MEAMQNAVKEFHQKFGCLTPGQPTIPNAATLLLRIRLLSEELSEFIEEASRGDLVGMADALGDLLYVTLGTGLSLGIDLEPVFQEIHRSNMTKSPHRDMGGKVTKGPEYQPPDIQAILLDQLKAVAA